MMKQLKITRQITNRETQSLDKYLQEIGKVSLITSEMEVDLTQRIRQGDIIALEKLTKANLRFVVSVAKQYQHNGLSLGDLINEGNLGLIKAATRFDETRGFKFISYAVWWIRQSIMQALAEQSRIVRLPLNRVGSINKMYKTFAALEQKFQREPSIDEVADSMQVTADQVQESMMQTGRAISVDAPFIQGEDNNMHDVLPSDGMDAPDANLMDESLVREIKNAMSALSSREAEVISNYFGLDGVAPMTLDEIGKKFNLTRERVRQIKEQATRRLRAVAHSGTLKSYL